MLFPAENEPIYSTVMRDKLNDTGVEDNTLVVFLNDNGGPIYTEVQSNAPSRLGKLFLFEGGIRVPMIVRWPRVLQPGTVYGKPVSSLDVFPTACAAADIDLPSDLKLDGVDLLPYLKGENVASPHDALFWSNGPNKAVRLENWKIRSRFIWPNGKRYQSKRTARSCPPRARSHRDT